MASAGYGLSGGGFDIYGDKDLFKVKGPGAAAPQTGTLSQQMRQGMFGGKPNVPAGPSPTALPIQPEQTAQAMAEQDPAASVASLASVASAPEPADVGFTGAGPGVLRPGLPTHKPAPSDGGLKALQRKVY